MLDPDEHHSEAMENDDDRWPDEAVDSDCYEGPSDLFDDD